MHLRSYIANQETVPFIGVYDVFSASIAAKYFDSLFVSGFSFAASYYGLPDIGFIAWSDIVSFVQRLRVILPKHNLLVDIDDGYADTEVACHVATLLESAGATGIILEDQLRPRKCGHMDGKQILPLNDYLAKLKRVLNTRRDLFVVARTDAETLNERTERAIAFAEAGADAILIDAIPDLNFVRVLKEKVNRPIVYNQIAGGKSPIVSIPELQEAGAAIVLYSTPCLFAAEASLEATLQQMRDRKTLPQQGDVGIKECNNLLQANLAKSQQRG